MANHELNELSSILKDRFHGFSYEIPPKLKGGWNFRSVSGSDGYIAATTLGANYAALIALWLKGDTDAALNNCLGHLVSEIDFKDESKKGYWVGFFTQLGCYISVYANQNDVLAHLDKYNAELTEMSAHEHIAEVMKQTDKTQ